MQVSQPPSPRAFGGSERRLWTWIDSIALCLFATVLAYHDIFLEYALESTGEMSTKRTVHCQGSSLHDTISGIVARLTQARMKPLKTQRGLPNHRRTSQVIPHPRSANYIVNYRCKARKSVTISQGSSLIPCEHYHQVRYETEQTCRCFVPDQVTLLQVNSNSGFLALSALLFASVT